MAQLTNLQMYRQARGLKQLVLAKACLTSQSTISLLETRQFGLSDVSLELLESLKQELKFPGQPHELLDIFDTAKLTR